MRVLVAGGAGFKNPALRGGPFTASWVFNRTSVNGLVSGVFGQPAANADCVQPPTTYHLVPLGPLVAQVVRGQITRPRAFQGRRESLPFASGCCDMYFAGESPAWYDRSVAR